MDKEAVVDLEEEELYRKNLKNRESDKEGPQNLHLERATIARRQGASEIANFEITPTTSETDSSGSFGIHQRRKPSTLFDHLEINGHTYAYQHLAIEIAPVNIASWLKAQSLFPKVCWFEKGGKIQRAALGNLLSFPTIPHISIDSHPEVRLYGGRQFSSGSIDPSWRPFPSCAFWLPQFEIVQEKEHAVLHIHFLNEDAHPSVMRQLCFEEQTSKWHGAVLEARQDFPTFPDWEKMVAASLEKIEDGLLEKVVVARKTKLLTDQKLDSYALLSEMQSQAQRATVFSFQLTPEASFIGATPEQLYKRQGSRIQTDAVAGTRPRGETPEEDLFLSEELLENPKEQREFAFVKQFIQTALEPLCTDMEWNEEDTVLQMSHVQHIYNHLTAILKNGVSDHDLIATLHPTPALGGKPRSNALSLLSELEPFQRGWYGAPIGYISSQEADIAVAIRSALIRGKEIDLYAGTGIVKGSHPEKEWDELEQKIKTFKKALL